MINFRWLIRRDMPVVLDIEQQSFQFPWTEDDFFRALRQRSCIGMVAEELDESGRGNVLGYFVYRLHPHHFEIVNFAIHPAHRRQGVGSLMAEKLAGKLINGRTRLEVFVSDFNLGAQLFWSAIGFHAVGIDRNKFDECEAYRFVRRRTTHHVTINAMETAR